MGFLLKAKFSTEFAHYLFEQCCWNFPKLGRVGNFNRRDLRGSNNGRRRQPSLLKVAYGYIARPAAVFGACNHNHPE